MRCKSEGRPQRRPSLTVVPDYAGIQTHKRAAGFGLPKRRSEQQEQRLAQAPSERDDEHDSDAESGSVAPPAL